MLKKCNCSNSTNTNSKTWGNTLTLSFRLLVSREKVIQEISPVSNPQDEALHRQLGGERHRRHPLPGDGHLPHRRLRDEPVHRGGASAGDNLDLAS